MSEVLRLIWRFDIIISSLALRYASNDGSGAGIAILGFPVGYVGVRLSFAHLPDRIGGAKVGAVSMAIGLVGLVGQLLLWQSHDPLVAGQAAALIPTAGR